MSQPYSLDLRERVVAAVEKGELSARQAAAQFGVGASTAIRWVDRLRRTGSVRPSKSRRLQAAGNRGRAPLLAAAPHPGEGLYPAWAGGRARRPWTEGGLPLSVDLRP